MDDHDATIVTPAPPAPSTATRERGRLRGPVWAWWLGSIVALVGLASGLTQALLSHAQQRMAAQAVASATAAAVPRYFADLSAVAMTSADDVWALGTWGQAYGALPPRSGPPSATPSGCQVCTLILHYDGHSWTRVPVDPSLVVRVVSVSMLSATDGWAVGGNSILHYTNGAWRLATSFPNDPEHSVGLKSIAMVSASEGWIAGYQMDPATGDGPLLLHYLNGTWTPVHLPSFDQPRATIESVSMLPSGDGWVVGGEYTDAGQRTLILHYSHGTWTSEPTSVPAQLNGVDALSRTEAWAVGTKDIAIGPGVILHYLNGTWSSVPSPTPNLLHTVVMRSPREGWAGGDGAATLRYDGTGWTKVDLVIHGYELTSLAVVGSEGWGVGSYGGQDVQSPLMLHYYDGSWSAYPLPLTLP